MAGKRLDVCHGRPYGDAGKKAWTKVGVAFDGDKGMSILLEYIPLPDKDGKIWLSVFEPKPRDAKPPADASTSTAPDGWASDANNPGPTSSANPEDVPF